MPPVKNTGRPNGHFASQILATSRSSWKRWHVMVSPILVNGEECLITKKVSTERKYPVQNLFSVGNQNYVRGEKAQILNSQNLENYRVDFYAANTIDCLDRKLCIDLKLLQWKESRSLGTQPSEEHCGLSEVEGCWLGVERRIKGFEVARALPKHATVH